MRTLLAFACLLAGCASAGVAPTGNNPDSGTPQDSPDDPPDSPPLPVEARLQQTTNETVTADNSIACVGAQTASNSWYRVFSLAEAGVTNAFAVSKITFAVETATNEPPVTVKVGSYAGSPDDNAPLNLAQASFLATTTAAVANTATAVSIDVPITATIPAGTQVIVEITSTDRTTAGDVFFLGTTNGPFQHTSYLASAECGIAVPTAMKNVCADICAASQAIISVTGTH
jgi:uncharacterized hydantoinase/oxoprolinase family protein